MKKIFLFILISMTLAISEKVSAQFSAGPSLQYATRLNSIGIGGDIAYKIDKNWTATGGLAYYLKKHDGTLDTNWFTIDLNGNFFLSNIEKAGKLNGYFGLNIKRVKYKDKEVPSINDSSTDLGLNLGVNMRIALSDNMFLYPDLCVTIDHSAFLRLGVKLMFGL